jgi:prophage maintenance system killer protein
MTNPEIFSENAIKNIALINEHVCRRRPELIGVDHELLRQIFANVNNNNDIPDKRKRIVRKAAHILAGIIFYQPFKNGNKTTAEIIMKHFLTMNDYRLPIRTDKESREWIKLEIDISPLILFENQYDIALSKAENHLLLNIEDLK